MSARAVAASRVIARTYGKDFDTDDTASKVLKAADRITYGRERLEAAAEALWNQRPAKRTTDGAPWPWEHLGEPFKNRHRQQVAAVIAVLREVSE